MKLRTLVKAAQCVVVGGLTCVALSATLHAQIRRIQPIGTPVPIALPLSLPVPIDQIPLPTYIFGGNNSVTKNLSYSYYSLFGGCSSNTQTGTVNVTDSSFRLFGPNIGYGGIPMNGLVYDDGSVKVEILRKSAGSNFFFYKFDNGVSFRVDMKACGYGGTTYGWIRITVKGRKVAPTAKVTISNLNQTYDGTAKQPTASTMPAGLPIVFVYSGSPTTCIPNVGCEVYGLTSPKNVGTYNVVASLRDPNYQPQDVAGTLVINKAPAAITLSNLNQTYDGTAKQPTVSTTPTGAPVVLTYNGSTTPPMNAGSYSVVASVNDDNYQTSNVTGTLVINKAPATITLSSLNQTWDGNSKRIAVNTAPVDLTGVEVMYGESSTPPTDPGKYSVTVSISNPNYQGQTVKATLLITGPSATVPVGRPTVTALASTWIGVAAPFIGDANRNGYTLFEIQEDGIGVVFKSDTAEFPYLSGDSAWRSTSFTTLPNTTYLIRITFIDPDGVIGQNTQIIGPITTPPAGDVATTIGAIAVSQTDAELSIEVPFSGDANKNSSGRFDVATDPNGPWISKGASLPFFPKLGRIRGLTPGVVYWVRIDISDEVGVIGRNSEVLGPFLFTGSPNLALGKPVTADTGWGCCVKSAELTDGIIQYASWDHGYAFTGGLARWNGAEPGWKQATIDLGKVTTVNRAVIWYQNPQSVPTAVRLQSSNDGNVWTDLYAGTVPLCRTETLQMPGAWYYPACAHDITFSDTNSRFIRYSFDDRTLFNGYHEWISELELFNID